MMASTLLSVSSALHWLSSSAAHWLSFSVVRKSILHRLKYRGFGNIISLKFDQIGYPKTSFSHFLKYGENKESHVFTIDNTIVIKKKNVHNYRVLSRKWNPVVCWLQCNDFKLVITCIMVKDIIMPVEKFYLLKPWKLV